MQALFDLLGTLVNFVITSLEMWQWLKTGLLMIVGMMVKSISVFGTVMRMFPLGVASAVVGVFGGLIVLRIFGRS